MRATILNAGESVKGGNALRFFLRLVEKVTGGVGAVFRR